MFLNKKVVGLFVLLFLFFACKKSRSLKSTGKQVEITRSLSDFSQIVLYDNINLYLIQDTENKVILSGGKNLLPFVTTKVSDGKLEIRNTNKMNWLRSFKKKLNAYVHFKDVNQLFCYGSGSVIGQDTICQNEISITCWDATSSIRLNFSGDSAFSYIHTGAADIHINGKADYAYIYCGGNGFIYIDSLNCQNVFVNNSGTGDMYIKPANGLGIELYSIGNVYCESSPTILYKTITGSGKLIFQ